MRTMTKQSLDALEKTMPIIPEYELPSIVAGDGGGYYREFDNKCQLIDFLEEWDNEREAIFICYTDGTCAVYVDEKNYCDDQVCFSYFPYGVTSDANGDTLYSFPGYSNGRYINEWGHTHPSNSATGGDPTPGIDDPDALSGIPKCIWYNGEFHQYGN